MRSFKAIVFAVFLAVAASIATPALAGGPNGEVNHASGQTCSGDIPGWFFEEVEDLLLFQYLLEWLPFDPSVFFGDDCGD